MQDIRAQHALRFATLNPVTDLIDKCVGTQWYETPNFWNGGAEDAYTIDAHPDEAVFHWAIYGELFAGDLDLVLAREQEKRGGEAASEGTKGMPLGEDVRLEYIKYCVPDWACYQCQTRGGADDDPRRAVRGDRGTYKPLADNAAFKEHGNQLALFWLLQSGRFIRQWIAVLEAAGLVGFDEGGYSALRDDDDDRASWRQEMWEHAIMAQGLAGLEFLGCARKMWAGPDWEGREVEPDLTELTPADGDGVEERVEGGDAVRDRIEANDEIHDENKNESNDQYTNEADKIDDESSTGSSNENEDEVENENENENEDEEEDPFMYPKQPGTRVVRSDTEMQQPDPTFVQKLRDLRAKIQALPSKPPSTVVAGRETQWYPSLHSDLRICTSGYAGW